MIGREAQMRQHLAPAGRINRNLQPIGLPLNPDGTPNYDYLDLGEWWKVTGCGELGRGFVSNSRFASTATERVIPRTARKRRP